LVLPTFVWVAAGFSLRFKQSYLKHILQFASNRTFKMYNLATMTLNFSLPGYQVYILLELLYPHVFLLHGHKSLSAT